MSLAGDILIGLDVLKTAVNEKTKNISAIVGDIISARTISQNVEWWQTIGIVSIPSKADAGAKEATKVVMLRLGGHDIIIASRDKRGQQLAGDLKPGETMIYAPGEDGKGQARILLKGDGGIHAFTTEGNAEGGDGMTVALDAQSKEIRLLVGGNGLIINKDGCTLTAGDSALTLESSGNCSLIGTGRCQCDGSTVILGSVAVPIANSVCVGAAGLIAVGSSKVFAAIA